MKSLNKGGVSFEKARNAFRGSVNIGGARHRTRYYKTALGAKRALTALIRSVSAKAISMTLSS